jgi:hypothetical protein
VQVIALVYTYTTNLAILLKIAKIGQNYIPAKKKKQKKKKRLYGIISNVFVIILQHLWSFFSCNLSFCHIQDFTVKLHYAFKYTAHLVGIHMKRLKQQ